ncbi:MAG TPA: hypothetical protein DDW22_07855 [Prevotellaceae bacterium]|nr:hypothetical protein [Prevotellaceae bacterium]
MKILLTLLLPLIPLFPLSARRVHLESKEKEVKPDTIVIMARQYMCRLNDIARERDSLDRAAPQPLPDAYYWHVLTVPTLYSSVLEQMMAGVDSARVMSDSQLRRVYATNEVLAKMYVQAPWLVTQTEDAIRKQGTFREDITEKLKTDDRLSDKVRGGTLTPTVDDNIVVVTRRPNFWKVTGNTQLHFTQSHFSDNWSGGGENAYTGLATLTLNFNFNNQKKITWNNQLEAKLGFTTKKSDKRRVFRPNTNTLRYTTNWGYQAVKNLYYSGQINMSTQLVPNYRENSDVVQSDFLSPLDITIAPGIRYSIAWGKKKKFTGSLNVAPLAYNIRYVDRDLLVTNYGVRAGHNSKHSFGPNVTLNTGWQVFSAMRWSQRLFWYSNLHMTRIEWEHNFNFSINKLMNASLNVYPRIDDSSRNNKNDKGRYFMFKEYFSLGFNYNF